MNKKLMEYLASQGSTPGVLDRLTRKMQQKTGVYPKVVNQTKRGNSRRRSMDRIMQGLGRASL